MMQKINRETIDKLLASTERQTTVTIYLPTHTSASPPHISENQIRLKNLIHKAKDELATTEQGQQLSKELELVLNKLQDDLNFWENQMPGLLICARPGSIEMFSLPIDTDEYVAVDEQFHLAPIFALLNDNKTFAVLTVTQHNPKLFMGDIYGLQLANLDLPMSVKSALNIDEANQKSENQGSATGSSTNTGGFNGRGGARNPQEEDRMTFFRMIDHVVCNSIDRSIPLILAGIDAETTEYRSVSKFPRILRRTISGSFSEAKPEDLFEKAFQIVRGELIIPAKKAAIEELHNTEGVTPHRVAKDNKSIQEAVEQGRVDKLLTMMDRLTKDTIRDNTNSVSKITFLKSEDSKLLNRLALKVWFSSGTIINLRPNEMPHGTTMLARLRY